MSKFTGVVSSTGLDAIPPAPGAVEECPRKLLGLVCLKTSGYDCLCKQVASCDIATVQNEEGRAVTVELTMRLKSHDGLGDVAKQVIRELNLTGLRAGFAISRSEVKASFNLRRPENAPLVS